MCDEGWNGVKCMTRLCDPRCLEHGQCQNGTCLCSKGWNGKHCSLGLFLLSFFYFSFANDSFDFIVVEGCANGCSGHGECIQRSTELNNDHQEWMCVCQNGFSGLDCNVPLESKCGDNIDNDKGV